MYRTCIFCSKDLGANEAIEHFPVGSRVAFDSFKGRLWAVCPHCTRWNLAPIEERWEAVEEAEREFRDARMRVQSENIGMAKMRDGTRLIRIGGALQGEIAAWRYGAQLEKRRRNLYLAAGAGIATGGAILAGIPLIAGAGLSMPVVNSAFQLGSLVLRTRAERRIVTTMDAHESPTGVPLVVRRIHLQGATLTNVEGQLGMSVLKPAALGRNSYRLLMPRVDLNGERILLTGSQAQTVAARAMVDYNTKGASRKGVQEALSMLESAGSAQNFIDGMSHAGVTLRRNTYGRRGAKINFPTPRQILGTFKGYRIPVEIDRRAPVKFETLGTVQALALEMALHDESERRAMEGELDILEEAWREAETIARIADALPGEPPED